MRNVGFGIWKHGRLMTPLSRESDIEPPSRECEGFALYSSRARSSTSPDVHFLSRNCLHAKLWQVSPHPHPPGRLPRVLACMASFWGLGVKGGGITRHESSA